jgi:anti-anti-sigma factor
MSDTVQIIRIHGRFDAHQVGQIKHELEAHLAQGDVHLVVNLQAAHFVDTRALSLLVTGMKRCRQQGGDLRICALQQPVRIIFELMHFDRAFQIFESEAEAVASFRVQDLEQS